MSTKREQALEDAAYAAYQFLMSRFCHDRDGTCWSDSEAMHIATALANAAEVGVFDLDTNDVNTDVALGRISRPDVISGV